MASERVRLNVIGQVVGASGLGVGSAHCEWRLESGEGWRRVAGEVEGSSQCDRPVEGDRYQWHHPVDVTLEGTSGLTTDWPRIEIEVRWRDGNERSDLAGYAVANVPTEAGVHAVTAQVWKPQGSLMDRIAAFFIGGAPALKERRLIFGVLQGGASSQHLARGVGRERLVTSAGGSVHLSLGVVVQTLPPADDLAP